MTRILFTPHAENMPIISAPWSLFLLTNYVDRAGPPAQVDELASASAKHRVWEDIL